MATVRLRLAGARHGDLVIGWPTGCASHKGPPASDVAVDPRSRPAVLSEIRAILDYRDGLIRDLLPRTEWCRFISPRGDARRMLSCRM